MQLVEPQSQLLIPGILNVERKKPSISSVRRRMGVAYERLEAARQEEADQLSPKTASALGKLVLELEQVNGNLVAIQNQIRSDINEKKRIFAEEKKLVKQEEDNLKGLSIGLGETRTKIAAFSALISGKALLEGRFGEAAQSASLAVGAMLPEIINIVSSVILGKALLGGRGGTPAAVPRTAGMRMPRMSGRLGLLGLGAAAVATPMLLGGSARADERRQELVKQQTQTAVISQSDVERFQSILTRFDSIISKTGGAAAETEEEKVAREGLKSGKDGSKLGPTETSGDGATAGNVNAADIKADTAMEKAFIATIREVEGTAGEDGYSKFFGGSKYGGDLTKKTIAEVIALQEKFLKEGKGQFFDKRTGKMNQSAVVGIGQERKPEAFALAAGLDITKQLYDEAYQNSAMLWRAKQRGVNPESVLTAEDIKKLNPEWSGLGPYYKQTNRTIDQSLKIYQGNMLEVDPAYTPEALEAIRAVDDELGGGDSGYGGDFKQSKVSVVPIPGKTTTAPSSTPKPGPSSTEVAFNTEYESVDKLQSKFLLGVFG